MFPQLSADEALLQMTSLKRSCDPHVNGPDHVTLGFTASLGPQLTEMLVYVASCERPLRATDGLCQDDGPASAGGWSVL